MRRAARGAKPHWLNHRRGVVAAICLAATTAVAQQAVPVVLETVSPSPETSFASMSAKQDSGKSSTKITPEQAKQLFSLVDELIKFSSEETGLPIKSTVKRQIVISGRTSRCTQKKTLL